jgi:2'-phosphotransferase
MMLMFQVDELGLKPVKSIADIPSKVVIHGTYKKHWPSIKTQGLCRMSRNHIHFALGEYNSSHVISGPEFCSLLLCCLFSL